MANEILTSGGIVYSDALGQTSNLQSLNVYSTISTTQFVEIAQSITTSPVAINLGPLATLGWCIFKNLDPTNYIEILTGTGGVKFARIYPGKTCGPIYLGSGVTAPFAQANTAVCLMQYLICAQ